MLRVSTPMFVLFARAESFFNASLKTQENVRFENKVCPLFYKKTGTDLDLSKYQTDVQKRADELINQLELEKVKHSFPGTLSGGKNRRAVIARALINDPKVIIADEPS